MFKVDDVIVYGTQGVCRIECIEEKSVAGAKKNYYVLKPVNDRGSTIFAPTDNAHVLKKMRRLLTKDEIIELIDSMPDENTAWINNDNDRKEYYKQVLAGGDRVELIRLIKAIYDHRKAREADGKRLHMIDEHFFKEAEQVLYNEFQYVLQMESKEALLSFILSRVEQS